MLWEYWNLISRDRKSPSVLFPGAQLEIGIDFLFVTGTGESPVTEENSQAVYNEIEKIILQDKSQV